MVNLYSFDVGDLVNEFDVSGNTNSYARTPNGLLIDQRTPSGHYNPLYDGQGDIIGLVSSTGKVERTFRYGPYGENTKSEGTQTIPDPFGFKGGYRMPGGNKGEGGVTNGLYHFGQRYYDPTTGRWTQQDPEDRLGSPTQGDRYLYAGEDPINLSDPSGLCFVLSCGEYHELGEEAESSVEGMYEYPEDTVACSYTGLVGGICEEYLHPKEAG